jgi:hypothetical protein
MLPDQEEHHNRTWFIRTDHIKHPLFMSYAQQFRTTSTSTALQSYEQSGANARHFDSIHDQHYFTITLFIQLRVFVKELPLRLPNDHG